MDFLSSLTRERDTIERPPNLPLGHYTWVITKHPSNEKMGSSGYAKLTFTVKCLEAQEDVDADELEAFGNCNGHPARLEFIFDETEGGERNHEDTLFKLTTFLENLGVNTDAGNVSAWLAESVNTSFMAEMTHRPDKNDDEKIYEQLRNPTTAPA